MDAFELWCWRRLLRVPWTARRSNQSTLKDISPGCSLEGLMMKLKLQYFGHLMWRAGLFEKTLMLGKIEGMRRRWQRMRWLDGITNSMDMGLGWLQSWWWIGRPGMLWFMAVAKSRTWLSNWTELNWTRFVIAFLSRSKHLLISWLQSPSAVILEPKKIVWHCFHCFPIYFPWSDGTGCHDLRFLNVEL